MPQISGMSGENVVVRAGKTCGAGGLTLRLPGCDNGPASPCFREARLAPKENPLLATPTPAELTAPINPDRGVEGHRNLFCGNYDSCLDEAVKQSWNSWTCTRCSLFAIQPQIESSIESYATQRRLA